MPPLQADWVCSACGQRIPFGHGDVFRYVRDPLSGHAVYQRPCPSCGAKMEKVDR
jgi:rubrerythrin